MSLQDDHYNKEIVHDFLQENLILMVFGGYVLLGKKKWHLLLNICYIVSVFVLHIVMDAIIVRNIITSPSYKATTVHGLQLICLSVPAMLIQSISYLGWKGLRYTTKSLRAEVFLYNSLRNEKLDIMKRRTTQARVFVKIITLIILFDVFSSCIIGPILRTWFVSHDDQDAVLVNPSLPLPVIMPFNTNTYFGFFVAFMAHFLYYFFIHAVYICHEQVMISLVLQICAQLEILNYSLENIEERAYLMFKNRSKGFIAVDCTELLYALPEFQDCLYSCLRENVEHHLTILRLKSAASLYLEATYTVALLFFSAVMGAAMVILLEDFRNNMAFAIMLLTDIVGFLQMCWVGQMITDLSLETRNALYSTPWYFCNKKYNTLLQIMLSNTQKPMILKGTGMGYDLSLETFSDMISLGYKIMNVFR